MLFRCRVRIEIILEQFRLLRTVQERETIDRHTDLSWHGETNHFAETAIE